MAFSFKPAVKHESKARIAIAGPSGSGKTYTSLLLASALAGDGGVAVLDTERGSASKYADLFNFSVIELDNFHPNNFIDIIHEAERAGFGVLVIDSLSHAWSGTGGLLEIVESVAKRSKSANTFTAWSEATPIQNRLIDAITRAHLHVICTMRSKQEYSLERDERTGRNIPRKVGMAPVQRNDVEYEFDCFFEMDYSNTLIVQKSRCSALANQVIEKPDGRLADTLKAWLDGAPMPVRKASRDQLNVLFSQGKEKGLFADRVGMAVYITEVVERQVTADEIADITNDEAIRVDYAIAAAKGAA